MLDFVRKNSLEYFKRLTFEDPKQKDGLENKKLSKEKDYYEVMQRNEIIQNDAGKIAENRKIEEVKEEVKMVVPEMMRREEQTRGYMPTQSQVITDCLKGSTDEMMRLMRNLIQDLHCHDEEIQKNPNAAGYWKYIYHSAVYLQQIINDITVAHNSTLIFMQQSGKVSYGPNANIP